ncbi:hypothetical protein [Mucilaginibacter lappiensis]|jgi:hypothetical protein|uniref:hypothetical protein n=1 Tax=Mucilaginibacter lappiensis TaxID=354630 RepID=UPI003D1F9721
MTDEAALMMEDNLNQVWNERDPDARLKVIEIAEHRDVVQEEVPASKITSENPMT